MPWKEVTPMSQKEDFIALAQSPHANLAALCRRFGISRKTAYKWLHRYREGGVPALVDRSRRPRHCPHQIVDDVLVGEILAWRDRTGWGGRKIKAVLEREGRQNVPAASTISAILDRHGRIHPYARRETVIRRFEAPQPNDLWQMDFKGPIRLRDRACEPLTVLDDCTRYSLALRACSDKTGDTVKAHLIEVFRFHGLPWTILADNGKPWGHFNGRSYFTTFALWLLRLDVALIHSRPYHPQTCGKEERFHRTLKQELTGDTMNCRFDQCQTLFDAWRHQYNTVRPHEALAMQPPVSRYQTSRRLYPEGDPAPEYDNGDEVRSARFFGRVRYRGTEYPLGHAFTGERVAIRPTERDGIMAVYYYKHKVAELNLHTGKTQ